MTAPFPIIAAVVLVSFAAGALVFTIRAACWGATAEECSMPMSVYSSGERAGTPGKEQAHMWHAAAVEAGRTLDAAEVRKRVGDD